MAVEFDAAALQVELDRLYEAGGDSGHVAQLREMVRALTQLADMADLGFEIRCTAERGFGSWVVLNHPDRWLAGELVAPAPEPVGCHDFGHPVPDSAYEILDAWLARNAVDMRDAGTSAEEQPGPDRLLVVTMTRGTLSSKATLRPRSGASAMEAALDAAWARLQGTTEGDGDASDCG